MVHPGMHVCVPWQRTVEINNSYIFTYVLAYNKLHLKSFITWIVGLENRDSIQIFNATAQYKTIYTYIPHPTYIYCIAGYF